MAWSSEKVRNSWGNGAVLLDKELLQGESAGSYTSFALVGANTGKGYDVYDLPFRIL